MNIDVTKLDRARKNLVLVRERLVMKLGSSTTGAQNHLGLLTSVESDLRELDTLYPVEVKTKSTYTKKEASKSE